MIDQKDSSTKAANELIMEFQNMQRERNTASRDAFEEARRDLKNSQTMFNIIQADLTTQYYKDRVDDRKKFMEMYDKALTESQTARQTNTDSVIKSNNDFITDERDYLKKERGVFDQNRGKIMGINFKNAELQQGKFEQQQQEKSSLSTDNADKTAGANNGAPVASTSSAGQDQSPVAPQQSGQNTDDQELDRFNRDETVQSYLIRHGIGVSELDAKDGPYIDMGGLNLRKMNELSQAERSALVKTVKLFAEDKETAKTAKEIHEKNREINEKRKTALGAELKQKLNERKFNRDIYRIMSVNQNYNTLKRCSKEQPMVTEVCKEITESKSINPQIIELGEGQIYRMGYFGAPSQKNIERIQGG